MGLRSPPGEARCAGWSSTGSATPVRAQASTSGTTARPTSSATTSAPDSSGTAELGNGIGIAIETSNNLIGESDADRNLISAQLGVGIIINSPNASVPATDNLILGNLIGTDATGTLDLGNFFGGVGFSFTAFNNTVGGTFAGNGNVIAFSRAPGAAAGVGAGGPGNSVLGNSIFENSFRGISRGGTVTPTPVLNSAVATSIAGTLSGPPNAGFRLEFFATPNISPRSAFHGKTFLGAMAVTTDGAGATSFTFSPPGGVPAGQFLTATATGPDGTTSEFSDAITATAAAVPAADLSVNLSDAPDPVLAGGDLSYAIVVHNAGPDVAPTVALTAPIPAGTTFVSFTAPADWTPTVPAIGGIGPVSATASSLAAARRELYPGRARRPRHAGRNHALQHRHGRHDDQRPHRQ